MLSAEIGKYAAGLQFGDLPPAVVEAAKIAVTDWLGCVLAGAAEPPAAMIAAVVRAGGGSPQATLIGFRERTAAPAAGLVNGASCHALELDDLHRASILHPAAPVISAAAAMAELMGGSGKDLITAVVAGYETGIRIAEAVTPSHYRYWHTTGTCGTFGAAVAAARAAGLNEARVVDTLGSAGSQAAGLWEILRDGAMTKVLHAGKAAMNGVLAALLAREGFSGAKRILEGEKGFFRAAAADFDSRRVTRGLGRDYRILENSYKLYPSCRHTHSGADLAIRLAQAGILPEQVEKILIRTYTHARDLTGGADPATPYAAKFSLPFCVASALVHGKLDLRSFEPAAIADSAVRALAARCSVTVDPSIERLYPARWPAALELTLRDGRVICERTEFPRGDPENPAAPEEMKAKFAALARRRLPAKAVRNTLALLEKLEQVEKIERLFKAG